MPLNGFSAPRTPEHAQAVKSVKQWSKSTGKVFRFRGLRKGSIPLSFGYAALDLADPDLCEKVKQQNTNILCDQRLLDIVKDNIRDALKPPEMAKFVADPLTDIMEVKVKFMIEDTKRNSRAINFVLNLATPRQTAAYLAGLLTEAGRKILLSEKCPSIDTLRGFHQDELDNSIGCYLALNLRTLLAYIGSRTSWLPIGVPGHGGINVRKVERENIDYLLFHINSFFNFYMIDQHGSQDPSDWTVIDKSDMIWIPMMLSDRTGQTQPAACRARAYASLCEPILSLCLATHHQGVAIEHRSHSIWQKTWWTGGNGHCASNETIHGLPYHFLDSLRKFKIRNVQEIEVLRNLSPDSAWLTAAYSINRLKKIAMDTKFITKGISTYSYGELLAELINAGIQPPSMPDPAEMGEAALLKLTRQELLDMAGEQKLAQNFSKKNIVKSLLTGEQLLNKFNKKTGVRRQGSHLSEWSVFSAVELRRQAVKHGISFFSEQMLETRNHLIAKFFLAGLGHLAGDEMIRRGMGDKLGLWSLMWQFKARGLDFSVKDMMARDWRPRMAPKIQEAMGLEPDYDTPEVYEGEPWCGWDMVTVYALYCHPHRRKYKNTRALRKEAVFSHILSRQASDPSCYSQFTDRFLSALLEVTLELKHGITRRQARKKIASINRNDKAALATQLYIENGGIPGLPDTSDPDSSEQLTAGELHEDSDGEPGDQESYDQDSDGEPSEEESDDQDSGYMDAGNEDSDEEPGEEPGEEESDDQDSGYMDAGNEDSDEEPGEEPGEEESDDQDSGIIYKDSGSKRLKVYGKRVHGNQNPGNREPGKQQSGDSLSVDDEQRGAPRQTAKRKVPVLDTAGQKSEKAPDSNQAKSSFKYGRMYTEI